MVPVCATAAHSQAMPDKPLSLSATVTRARRDPLRSPLFHWFVENYRTVEPLTRLARVDWTWMREKVVALGITDDQGNSPTNQTMRRTLRNVVIEIEAEDARRREAAARKSDKQQNPSASLPPSRLPANLRPPVARPTHAPHPAPTPTPAPMSAASYGLGPDGGKKVQVSDEEVEAQLAAVRQKLRQIDRL